MRRLARVVVVLLVAWPLALLLAGWLARGAVKSRARARIAAALEADVAIDGLSVNLLTGRVELRGLRIRRAGVGEVAIRVDRAEVKLASLGRVLWDRDVRRASLRGVDIQVDAAGVATLPPRRAPPRELRIGSLTVRDARLAVAPTRLLPRLGRAELAIARARAADVRLRDGLSWLLRLTELDADLTLPSGARVSVTYAGARDQLTVRGSLFGSAPLAVPVPLPAAGPDGYELGTLAALARAVAEPLARALVARGVAGIF